MKIPARLILSEWLADHPAEIMQRAWTLTESQRRRVVAIIKDHLGEPDYEFLAPLDAIAAMGEAGQEHGLLVWGATERGVQSGGMGTDGRE